MSQKSRIVVIRSLKNQRLIAEKCIVAERFFDRLIGLIGKRSLATGEGMLFPRCNNVHMWFMQIPLDIVFLSRANGGNTIVHATFANVRQWKMLPVWSFGAEDTLELPVGTISRCAIEPGDPVCIS